MNGGHDDDPDHFDPVTKMPPFQKNFSPHALNETHATTHKNYAPLPWEAYFEELYYLSDGTSVFQAGKEGALFFCIHGAGLSALSFATLAK